MMSAIGELRYQPTPKRIRVVLDGREVVDTTRAVLVWEPMRVVPSYAVPEADVHAVLEPAPGGPPPQFRSVGFGADSPALLDPSVPFDVHTADGDPLVATVDGGTGGAAAFRLHDDALRDHVVLDFDAFAWWEEDEPIVGHPRDPFHRIDVRRSSRPVRIEHEGWVLAASSRSHMLFESTFPVVRYYLPRDDVRAELRPGALQTTCAYKGHATHYDVVVGDGVELPDAAWSYHQPLDDVSVVADQICFYQERLDVFLDDEPLERVRTPWS